MKFTLREILLTVLVFVLIFVGIRLTVHSYKVHLSSMLPSFEDGEYILVNKVSYHFHAPHRGDVVVFHTKGISGLNPSNVDELYIKRVIGLPGETVEIKNGAVYINGTALKEPDYIPALTSFQMSAVTVPPDNYFVLGDNRNGSLDSRYGWTVPRGNIVGKTWLAYWPPSDWGLSPKYSWALA